jgi:hypothetical protein
MKNIADFTDTKGFIGHKHQTWGLEFGDGCQRTGTYYIKLFIEEPDRRIINAHKLYDIMDSISRLTSDSDGRMKKQYVRHWDSQYWPGQLWTMSRDNLDPMLMACVLFSPHNNQLKATTDELLGLLWKRKGFLWNYKHIWPKGPDEPKLPDWYFLLLTLLMYTVRHKKKWYLYPLVWVTDVQQIFMSLIRLYMSWKHPIDTSDDLNHQNKLVFNQLIFNNPINWIAKLLYKLRLRSGPDKNHRLEGYGPYTAYLQYYSNQNAPPMPDEWKPVIDKYL